jgi:hypothetical protein
VARQVWWDIPNGMMAQSWICTKHKTRAEPACKFHGRVVAAHVGADPGALSACLPDSGLLVLLPQYESYPLLPSHPGCASPSCCEEKILQSFLWEHPSRLPFWFFFFGIDGWVIPRTGTSERIALAHRVDTRPDCAWWGNVCSCFLKDVALGGTRNGIL